MLFLLVCLVLLLIQFFKAGGWGIYCSQNTLWIILRESSNSSRTKMTQEQMTSGLPNGHIWPLCTLLWAVAISFLPVRCSGVWVWCKASRGHRKCCASTGDQMDVIGVNHHKTVRTLSKSLSTLPIKEVFKTNKTQEVTSKWVNIM